jgi:hypothetical protein
MVLHSGGFPNERERCFKLPREHRTKTDELWQPRGYSWRLMNATWKVGVGLTSENNKA